MFLKVFFVFLCFQKCFSVIYHLNASDYDRMPPVFHLDPYEPCLQQPGGVYCSAELELVNDTQSELMTLILEYSAHKTTHFDHTKLHYGICVSKTCKDNHQQNTTADQATSLEACVNKHLLRDYQLTAKINGIISCSNDEEKIEKLKIDAVDLTVSVIIGAIVMANIIGSLREFQKTDKGNNFLSCFAVQRNWRKLVAPAAEGSDDRITLLKGLCGIRAATMVLVIGGHALLPFVLGSTNTQYVEEAFTIFRYLGTAGIVVQTFFVMSGFLLMYNIEIYTETHRLYWTTAPKFIFLRWLRLAPAFLVVLGVTMTWARFAGSGPLWEVAMNVEVDHCRRSWVYNLLLVSNYVDTFKCHPESWYIGSDMQLSIVGVVVAVFVRREARRVVLSLLLLIGLVTPMIHTYMHDLDGALLLSPEPSRHFFFHDATFNGVYKRGHNNLACYVIGLALGTALYDVIKRGDSRKYTKYRFAYWTLFPCMCAVIASGTHFYSDAPRASLQVRMLTAALYKPLFGLTGAAIIAGLVLQIETLYRGILEGRWWALPARVSYSAYLLHVSVIRYYVGHRTYLLTASFYNCVLVLLGCIIVSFLAAIPFTLLIESPINELVKRCFTAKKYKTGSTEGDTLQKSAKKD